MIYRFKASTTPGPEGTKRTLPGKLGITALAEIDGWRYIHIPDDAELPDLDFEIEPVDLSAETREAIRRASGYIAMVNATVLDRIRAEYSAEDELGLLRLDRQTEDFRRYNDHVEACREWGRAEKAKVGL